MEEDTLLSEGVPDSGISVVDCTQLNDVFDAESVASMYKALKNVSSAHGFNSDPGTEDVASLWKPLRLLEFLLQPSIFAGRKLYFNILKSVKGDFSKYGRLSSCFYWLLQTVMKPSIT